MPQELIKIGPVLISEKHHRSKIVSYRDDYHEERRPHTSKIPYTRPWKARFFGDKDDVFEEYNAEELAKHLSTAHDTGARGPAPEAGNEQLTAIPAARITGGAAAEGGATATTAGRRR